MRRRVADRKGLGVEERKNIYAKGQRTKDRYNPVTL